MLEGFLATAATESAENQVRSTLMSSPCYCCRCCCCPDHTRGSAQDNRAVSLLNVRNFFRFTPSLASFNRATVSL